MPQRRTFDEQFMKDRVREYVTGEKKVGEILEEHKLVSSVFRRMREKFEATVKKEIKSSKAAPLPADKPASSTEVVSAAEVRGTKHLSDEQRDELAKRLTNKEKPAHVARAMQIHPQTVHYYKKKLKAGGELIPAKTPGNGAPITVTPTMLNIADKLAALIHAEYDARIVDHIGPKESLSLALWHMHHGRL